MPTCSVFSKAIHCLDSVEDASTLNNLICVSFVLVLFFKLVCNHLNSQILLTVTASHKSLAVGCYDLNKVS